MWWCVMLYCEQGCEDPYSGDASGCKSWCSADIWINTLVDVKNEDWQYILSYSCTNFISLYGMSMGYLIEE